MWSSASLPVSCGQGSGDGTRMVGQEKTGLLGIRGGGGPPTKRGGGDAGGRGDLSCNKWGRRLRVSAELSGEAGMVHQGWPNVEAGGEGRPAGRR